MTDWLGRTVWQSLKYHIAEVHNFNANQPNEMVEGSKLFEKILTELLGTGARLIFRQINQKLAELFQIQDSAEFEYSGLGDYSKLIEVLKNSDSKSDVKKKRIEGE
jgi:hypothetical protein